MVAAIEVPTLDAINAELARRRGVPSSLAAFGSAMGFEPAAHHQIFADGFDDCIKKKNARKMFFAPPGCAKSTWLSILGVAFFLATQANKKVIAACHTADLAEYFGGEVRDLIQSEAFRAVFPAIKILPGYSARGDFKLSNGATYKAAGVGGPLSGRRADLLIIDDPVKDDEAAQSPVLRAKAEQWYMKVARTRLKPSGSIFVIMTRWHEADLGGFLLDTYQGWEQTTLRFVCEDEDDPLGRKIGERIWPEYFTELDVKEAKVDLRTFITLYQQRPTPMEGSFFQIGKIGKCHSSEVPPGDWYAAHDTGATEGGGDWSAFAAVKRGSDGKFYGMVSRKQFEPGKRNRWFLKLATAVSPVAYRIPEEIGIGGKENAQTFQKAAVAAGIHGARTQKISGDKETRAENLAAVVNAGLFILVHGNDSYDCVEEMRQFPKGKHDDMVDALSDAYNELISREKVALRVHKRTGVQKQDD